MHIDLIHDVACPWCRIGKRQLELALQDWHGESVEVRYHPFFLNDQLPPEGVEFQPYMRAKGGDQVPLEQFFDAPRRMGAAIGLTFNFERIERAPNTLLAHRLIALTPADRQQALTDAVYAAYFEHGQDIGDLDVLLGIAAAHGLDVDALAEQLRGTAARDEVVAEARWAQQQGIRGVPTFIFNQQYAISGAQPADVLLNVMKQVADLSATPE